MKPRVLIVDHEESTRNSLRTWAEREGYEAYAVSTASEAQGHFGTGKDTAVLITELRLPGQDGFWLMGWMRDKHPRTRVVAMTNQADKGSVIRAFRSGAVDYCEKPLSMDECMSCIKRCVQEYQKDQGAGGSARASFGNAKLEVVASPFGPPSESGVEGYMSLKKKWCDNFEREYLTAALARNGGNVSAAAREAKLDRSNFLRLLRRHGLRAHEFRKVAA